MRENTFTIWIVSPILLFAIIGAFARIMTSLNHNEHMYITASVLLAQGHALYKDFAYLQTPYLPLLYGTVFKLLGVSSFYLLTGKVISVVFLGISSITVFLVAGRVLNNTVLSLGVATLFLLNMTITNAATEVSNYIMPVAFSMVSFYVFIVSIENHIRPFGIALAGCFLAIAIGTKLTYATLVIPFIATSLFCALSEHSAAITAKRRIHCVLVPFIAGLAIGLLPMPFFLSDLESFLFNNLGYHNVSAQWRQSTGLPGTMSLYSKLVYALHLCFQADNLVVLLGILLGRGVSINSVHRIRWAHKRIPTGASLALLLVLIAVPTALAPTPSFPQYFAMPASFLFLLLIYSLSSTSVEIATLHRRVLLALVLVSVAYNGPSLLKSMSHLAHRDRWSGLHVHDVAMNLRNVLADRPAGTDYKTATLSPLFVIESNLPIYPELSTGPFLYRIGDVLTPEDRDRFMGTSPRSIDGLFNDDPPVAILVGFEGTLDDPLIEYAIANSYTKVDVPGFGGKVYVRP
jgi:hypothetical protein